MGHSQLDTTGIYLHLPDVGAADLAALAAPAKDAKKPAATK